MSALHRRTALAAATLLATLLAGCATGVGDNASSGTPTPPGGSIGPSSTPEPSGPGLPSRVPPMTPLPSKGEITVVGDVELIDIEGGCLVLRVGPTAYELFGGDRQMMQAGRRLSVRGRVRTDVATICQVGPVLEVLEARPA